MKPPADTPLNVTDRLGQKYITLKQRSVHIVGISKYILAGAGCQK
jgi:hypothetical protein